VQQKLHHESKYNHPIILSQSNAEEDPKENHNNRNSKDDNDDDSTNPTTTTTTISTATMTTMTTTTTTTTTAMTSATTTTTTTHGYPKNNENCLSRLFPQCFQEICLYWMNLQQQHHHSKNQTYTPTVVQTRINQVRWPLVWQNVQQILPRTWSMMMIGIRIQNFLYKRQPTAGNNNETPAIHLWGKAFLYPNK
jgi:hypothetical protein